MSYQIIQLHLRCSDSEKKKKKVSSVRREGVVISGTHITSLPVSRQIKIKYLQVPKIKVTGHIARDQEQMS